MRLFNFIFSFKILIIPSFIISQELPNEFLQSQRFKFFIDSGNHWDIKSCFGPVRHQKVKSTKLQNHDSLIIKSRLGFALINEKISLYSYNIFNYKNNFYGYLYPRIVNSSEINRYTGIPRDRSRAGFSSGETDIAGICFQNNWLLFQIGRGRQSWYAGENIELSLSENSPSYDYGLLNLEFGRLSVRYFHGFLESDSSGINRYITGRGIEWTNKKNFNLLLSETVIYSGLNRPLDFAYLNPISSHLEIELNNRQNRLGTENGNGVWQASIDILVRSNLRFSGNLLFDEFVIDKVEKEAGKENGLAYSLRISFTPIRNEKFCIINYISKIRIGTPTFRHGDGFNNFVQRGKPLGWSYGSDGYENKIGLKYFNHQKNIFGKIEIGQRFIGEESLLSNPYEPYSDYIKGDFPSGETDKIFFIFSEIQYYYKPHLSVLSNFRYSNSSNDEVINSITIGLNVYYPKTFKLK